MRDRPISLFSLVVALSLSFGNNIAAQSPKNPPGPSGTCCRYRIEPDENRPYDEIGGSCACQRENGQTNCGYILYARPKKECISSSECPPDPICDPKTHYFQACRARPSESCAFEVPCQMDTDWSALSTFAAGCGLCVATCAAGPEVCVVCLAAAGCSDFDDCEFRKCSKAGVDAANRKDRAGDCGCENPHCVEKPPSNPKLG